MRVLCPPTTGNAVTDRGIYCNVGGEVADHCANAVMRIEAQQRREEMSADEGDQ